MYKLTQAVLQCTGKSKRLHPALLLNTFSTSNTVAETRTVESVEIKSEKLKRPVQKSENSIVAAAFAALQSDTQIKTPFTDKKIADAKTIDELLSISTGSGISRRHALKVVSVLADWSTDGKVKLSDFEGDPRFLRLCRVLTMPAASAYKSGAFTKSTYTSKSEDLSTILSVTADDEAAKLVASITLPQMVKVMSMLATKRRRSTLLLRSLAYNIARSGDRLNLKQAADLLYNMAVLNFVDENLVGRIAEDVVEGLDANTEKSAVVGSIVTSLGFLKYRQPAILDALSDWILKHHSICRAQDIFGLFLTLAVVNYHPTNSEALYKTLIPGLKESEANKPSTWLDFVWSLTLLNQATQEHLSGVLDERFVENFTAKNVPSCLKLVNIDAAASFLMPAYSGPRLKNDSPARGVKAVTSKSREELVKCLEDTAKNLIWREGAVRYKVDTGMGFLIDMECLLDAKCNPVPFDGPERGKSLTRLAIMTHDYHDVCKGSPELTGIAVFSMRLLEARGYKAASAPYTEFKPSDKLVNRVRYIEAKLKEAAAGT